MPILEQRAARRGRPDRGHRRQLPGLPRRHPRVRAAARRDLPDAGRGLDRQSRRGPLRRARDARHRVHRRRGASCATGCSARPSAHDLQSGAAHAARALNPGRVTPPSGSSGRRGAGAPTAQTTAPRARRRGTPATRAPSARSRRAPAAGRSLGEVLHRGRELGERVGHPAEEQQDEEQPVGGGEVRLGPQGPGHQHADARERDGADEEQADRGEDPRRNVPADRDADRDDEDDLQDLEPEHGRGLGDEQAHPATTASNRAASGRRSGARSRSRCRARPSPRPSPRARARPGTMKSTGCAKSVETASTFAKNTRIPSGIASVTMRFSPRRSCRTVSARVCASSARRAHVSGPRPR